MMKTALKWIGKGFAYTGKGFIAAARYTSDHPEVLAVAETVATVSGHPEVAKGIRVAEQVSKLKR